MKWSVKGNGYETGSYVDEYGTGDHNFCRYLFSLSIVCQHTIYLRNPNGPDHPNPWCYRQSDGEWEDCAIPLCGEESSSTVSISSCPAVDCLTEPEGFNYRGPQSNTVSGNSCLPYIFSISNTPTFQSGLGMSFDRK